MPQSLSKIYVHFVFHTKNNTPWISKDVEKELHPYMSAVMRAMDSPALIVGGASEHIHILCILSRKIPVCKIAEVVKKSSSKWMKTKGPQLKNFRWQDGYGAFSISHSMVGRVRSYIRNQRIHHQKLPFKDEFLSLLNKSELEYEIKYLWE
jgi:REP element-mobilizing transposase RayT